MNLAPAARWVAQHRKLITYVVGAALAAAVNKWGASQQWVALAVLVCTGLGINQLPNEPLPPAAAPAVKDELPPSPPAWAPPAEPGA